jgi:rhamnogalacturonyl hydrolase YesR
VSTPFENVKNWILNSGIVITNEQNENSGGVYSFFDNNNQKYGFLYPEITGYSISTFCFLHQIENEENYIKLAKTSSDWIIGLFEKFGGIIQGLDNENDSRKQFAYSFDTAICAKGLLDYYNLTHDERYLRYSINLVKWLEGAMSESGTVLPYMELKSKEFKESDEVWYKKWGCLHIKTSIPFAQLYKITNEKKYLEYAQKICNTYTKFQNTDGSFSIHENSKIINLHTMAYALEGLFYVYNITKNEKYLQCVEKGLDWCTNQIVDDGSISLWFNSRHKSKAVYPIAQIIRLMILFDKFHNKNKYLKNILKLRSFMVSLQANNNNKKVNGGFFEEFYKSMFGWKKREKLNSWGSLFAMQALYWFDNYEKINFNESILSLY